LGFTYLFPAGHQALSLNALSLFMTAWHLFYLHLLWVAKNPSREKENQANLVMLCNFTTAFNAS
jgi:hypothetical protein